MHRNPSVFPSPNTFMPERWLETEVPGSAERLSRMMQYMMPFGYGTRVCGGQNVAQMMMKIVIAAVVRNFDVAAPVETNEQSMEIKDSFVSGAVSQFTYTTHRFQVIFPSAMECKLIFTPRTL
jgi:cytochrome P450